ncbi:MAG: hypothetical protein IKH47_02450, partial [Bacteroidaceae bacterium]|nr:hypothetical protein [Bacteroidaceae bacterium]
FRFRFKALRFFFKAFSFAAKALRFLNVGPRLKRPSLFQDGATTDEIFAKASPLFSRLLDCGSSEIEKRQGRHKDILLTHATISIGFSLCTPIISDYLKKKH